MSILIWIVGAINGILIYIKYDKDKKQKQIMRDNDPMNMTKSNDWYRRNGLIK